MTDDERALLLMTASAMERLLRIEAEALDEPPWEADRFKAVIDRVQSRSLPPSVGR